MYFGNKKKKIEENRRMYVIQMSLRMASLNPVFFLTLYSSWLLQPTASEATRQVKKPGTIVSTMQEIKSR